MSAITACRACDSTQLALILSLGRMPLANALVDMSRAGEPESTYPLDLVLCEGCSLVQITETVPPEILFREYRYFSSFSDTMLRHAANLADEMVARCNLRDTSLVAEIASNDGYLLKNYVARGIPVLGIEPARNVAEVADANGVRTIAEFFGRGLAEALAARGDRADVVHANNVMAHVPDIRGVLSGVRTMLRDDGVFVMETPYVKSMLDDCEFDTIYHEHLFYWSLTALENVARSVGLAVVDVERVAIHGGSLRVSMRRDGVARLSPAVVAMLDDEQRWGARRTDAYRTFAQRVHGLKRELVDLLLRLKADGKKIACYGAAAKGSTLLNYFGVDVAVIDFVADRSTHKQHRLMPGVRIPIVPAEELLSRRPDYCVLLTWNFADEILDQQREFRRQGGKFIIPVPQLRVL